MKEHDVAIAPVLRRLPHALDTTRPLPFLAGDQFTLNCTANYTVEAERVVLTSSLALDAVVTCTSSLEITATDIDNLERNISASVMAVDADSTTEVEAEASVTVRLDQVSSYV